MTLSTHILDTALGRPGADVTISLSQFREDLDGGTWAQVGRGRSDADGRCKPLLLPPELTGNLYRLHFDTGEYFQRQGLASLYPYVEIVFHVADPAQHYHIALLLTANGYTTYRGS